MNNPYHQKMQREISRLCADALEGVDLTQDQWDELNTKLADYAVQESNRSFLNGVKRSRQGSRREPART